MDVQRNSVIQLNESLPHKKVHIISVACVTNKVLLRNYNQLWFSEKQFLCNLGLIFQPFKIACQGVTSLCFINTIQCYIFLSIEKIIQIDVTCFYISILLLNCDVFSKSTGSFIPRFTLKIFYTIFVIYNCNLCDPCLHAQLHSWLLASPPPRDARLKATILIKRDK